MDRLTKQRAFDYSMFLMLSSYFDKAKCSGELQKKKLHLAYQELKDEDKDTFDAQSIAVIEKELLPNLPKDLVERDMQIVLLGNECNPCTEIRLSDEEYMLRVKAKYAKKNSVLVHEIWKKCA